MSWYNRTGISTDVSRASAGAQIEPASAPLNQMNSLREIFISRRLRDGGKSFQVHVVNGRVPGIPRVERDVLLEKSLRERVRDIRSLAGFPGCRGILSGRVG